jgi:23S rRNA (cytidine1920-2'-O)/16S rRNA (cytidine1409-2'-O)-methyltransferase
VRLDQYLVENGFAQSRNKAQTLIKEAKVRIDSKVVQKVSFQVGDETVSVDSDHVYVSRSAMKLKGFLPELPFDVMSLKTLDIGSSTGGFTEVLLEFGAESVDAVDVGSDQLHVKLKTDARVRSFENTDIRKFKTQACYDLVVSDVSFISLLHILDDVDRLAKEWIVLLFKPQFEVGREVKRDKTGVIKDTKAIGKAMLTFEDACTLKSWELIKKSEAIIRGKEGNIEYCYCYKKH